MNQTLRGMMTMLRTTLVVQGLVIGTLLILLGSFAGSAHAGACLVGASAVVGPFVLAGAILGIWTGLSGEPSVPALMLAETGKVMLTVAAMVIGIRWLGTDIRWPGFLAGMFAAWFAQWLTLWFTRDG